MKRVFPVILLISILSSNFLKAQPIDNRVDIKILYGIAQPLGDKTVNEGNFITPSLFRGYDNSYYYSIEGFYKFHPNYSIGISWGSFSFDNWINIDSELFSNSSSHLSSLGPLIMWHTRFKQTGVLNKLELFTTLSPRMTFIRSSLVQETLFSPEPVNASNLIIESNYTFFGASLNAGVRYSISQNIDLNLEIGGSYSMLNSQFYNDKNIVLLNAGAGIVFKLLRDKRYYLQ